MISAIKCIVKRDGLVCFSAIARSVMISAAASTLRSVRLKSSFSAIARSVMISASVAGLDLFSADVFQCYSS